MGAMGTVSLWRPGGRPGGLRRVSRAAQLHLDHRAEAERIADAGEHALSIGAAELQRGTGCDGRTERDRSVDRDGSAECDRGA